MNYREAFISIPLLITATATLTDAPASGYVIPDFAFGLKNWLGSVIHSLTLDYNGTTGLVV